MAGWKVRAATVLLALGWVTGALAALPQTGPVDPDFAPVDQAAQAYLAKQGTPGVSVVVAYGDRIVYAQGYGYANRELQLPTSPWLEYRLASSSKTFTATAVMRLVEQGRLSLDSNAWNLVSGYMGAEPKDPRVKTITVRQLLTFSWGLDRALSTDLNGSWLRDSSGKVLSTSRELLRYRLLNVPLDFAPGARYSYNGAGYSWLQLIAELIDGRPMDVQLTAAMGPESLSTGRIRIGSTLPSAITPAEPTYYYFPGAPQRPPVPGLYPAPEPATVPTPYGAFTLDAYGGGGGLIASPLTVTRFIQRLHGIRQPALVRPETWAQMRTEQPLADGTRYTGLGVQTVPAYGSDYSVTFNGSVPGTRTGWLSTPRSAGGPRVTIVALVNGTFVGATEANFSEDLTAELLTPVLMAVDKVGYGKVAAKPEISGERLVAWGTSTHDHLTDVIFDWAARTFSTVLTGTPQSGTIEGFRYRFWSSAGLYLVTKDGRLYLYQPAVNPTLLPLGLLTDFLPTATGTLPLR